MAHDRLDDDAIPLTHEFLSLMLGVRRAGVTVALNVLERKGVIGLARGQILITDRDGLKASRQRFLRRAGKAGLPLVSAPVAPVDLDLAHDDRRAVEPSGEI